MFTRIFMLVAFVAGVLVGISIAPVFAEEYHVGIIIDKTCEKINELDPTKCASYDDVEGILADTKLKPELMPDISKYSYAQQIKFKEQLANIKVECIRNNTCDYLDIREDQEIIIWHNPDPEMYPHLELITIRNQMKIASIYEVPLTVIRELNDVLSELHDDAQQRRIDIGKNDGEITTWQQDKIQAEVSLKKLKSELAEIDRRVIQQKSDNDFSNRVDPAFAEERLDELEAIQEEYRVKNKEVSDQKSKINNIRLDIQHRQNQNTQLQSELRTFSNEIRSNTDKIRPTTQINNTDTGREIVYNVNQVYVDIDCRESFFAVNNLEAELLALLDYMYGDCVDKELLLPFALTYTQTLPRHEVDITTSPNWQYQQEIQESINRCKLKC